MAVTEASLWAQLMEMGIKVPSTDVGRTFKVHCPKCHHQRKNKADKSLSVTIEKEGLALVHCHHCEWADSVYEKQVTKRNKSGGHQRVTQKPVEEVKSYRKLTTKTLKYPNTGLDAEVIGWFAKRKISEATLKKARVGYNAQSKMIIFPYFVNDEVVNCKYRRLGEKTFELEKDAQVVFYGLDNLKGKTECIIVEGEMDALALMEVGFDNVISVPNGGVKTRDENRELKYLIHAESIMARMEKVTICTDMDEVGRNLEHELARRIGPEKCAKVELPCKDANDVLIEHDKDLLCDAIRDAEFMPIKSVRSVSDLEKRAFDFFLYGPSKGVSTGWENVDRLYMPRPGDLTVVTGVPSSGKSEVIDALLTNLNQLHGWKFLYVSPENEPGEHMTKLVEKTMLKSAYSNLSHFRMTEEEFARGLALRNDKFFFLEMQDDADELTIDYILEAAKSVVYRHGIKGLVIDPYNELEHNLPNGMREDLYISKMLSKVKRFAKKYGIHIWFVAHPAKPDSKLSKKEFIPSAYDISGGANWNNKADVCITIHRPLRSKLTKFIVTKVRSKAVGERGEATLSWNWSSGTYSPVSDEKSVQSNSEDDDEIETNYQSGFL